MSTIEATVSMLESMPEEARIMVYKYTQSLFTSNNTSNPFRPKTTEDILSDLSKSRKEIAEGKGIDMKKGLEEMGAEHGFI